MNAYEIAIQIENIDRAQKLLTAATGGEVTEAWMFANVRNRTDIRKAERRLMDAGLSRGEIRAHLRHLRESRLRDAELAAQNPHKDCTETNCFQRIVDLTDAGDEVTHYQQFRHRTYMAGIQTCPLGDAEGRRIFGDLDAEFGTAGRLR